MTEQNLQSIVAAAAVTVVSLATIGAVGFYCGKEFSQKESSHDFQRVDLDRRIRMLSEHSACDVKVSDTKSLVDVRIAKIRPLVPPACLLEELPSTARMASTV